MPATDEELKKALKAFKKRLKVTQLDNDSRLGHSPLTGAKESVVSIQPPAGFVRSALVRVDGVEGQHALAFDEVFVDPATGRVLAAHRATANTLVEVMPTVDRLAGQLLRDIERRADAPPAAGPPAARPCAS